MISATADYPACILIRWMLLSKVMGWPFIDMKVRALMGWIDFTMVIASSRAIEPIPQINWLPLIRESPSFAWSLALFRPC